MQKPASWALFAVVVAAVTIAAPTVGGAVQSSGYGRAEISPVTLVCPGCPHPIPLGISMLVPKGWKTSREAEVWRVIDSHFGHGIAVGPAGGLSSSDGSFLTAATVLDYCEGQHLRNVTVEQASVASQPALVATGYWDNGGKRVTYFFGPQFAPVFVSFDGPTRDATFDRMTTKMIASVKLIGDSRLDQTIFRYEH
ncbi:MAG TPA: hypothetical protein VFZ17_07385 [Acidimicrobiia bacterium]|nr:hypothetical protein [Acidimicrobiia bacterium]